MLSIIANVIVYITSLLVIPVALPPVAAQERISLDTVTDQGTFIVELIWIPNDIGSANTFEIRFIDPDTGSEIEDVKYDISIYRDHELEIQRLDQLSNFQEFSFREEGSYEIMIDDIEDLDERVAIPIQVTPEFQFKIFVFALAAISVAVYTARHKGNNLFRKPIN